MTTVAFISLPVANQVKIPCTGVLVLKSVECLYSDRLHRVGTDDR